ncbi:MAG: hypothetical protein GEV13_30625 [Rhodospirillales bacterium]|nr:hypothetical protein [Rhodospirillales bacterium]
MALTDDLEDDVSRTNSTTTVIKERQNVAIVGQTHAFLKSTNLEIRTFGRRSSKTSCCKGLANAPATQDGCTPGLAAARTLGIEPCAHAD